VAAGWPIEADDCDSNCWTQSTTSSCYSNSWSAPPIAPSRRCYERSVPAHFHRFEKEDWNSYVLRFRDALLDALTLIALLFAWARLPEPAPAGGCGDDVPSPLTRGYLGAAMHTGVSPPVAIRSASWS
jgi:hypothetical protein